MSATGLAAIGSLLVDDTRSQILVALMDGRAYTGGELARGVGVSPSTASEHLSRLRDAGLITVEAQGRHRYFSLAGPQVAQLLETVGAAAPAEPRAPSALRYARTCYDHLAGDVAAAIYHALAADGHLTTVDHQVRLTPSGYGLLERVGVDVDALRSGRRATVRATQPCIAR